MGTQKENRYYEMHLCLAYQGYSTIISDNEIMTSGSDAKFISYIIIEEFKEVNKRRVDINKALKGLSQQDAYNIICDYKADLEYIYPLIEAMN